LAPRALGASVPAFADYGFQVPEASQLTDIVNPDSKVYLRNLTYLGSLRSPHDTSMNLHHPLLQYHSPSA
jgi:hypothetical protein